MWARGDLPMNEILRSGSWLLALVGSAYAIWIILDCWRQTRTAGEASKARKSISRSDLLSQLVAALVLLVVVVPMLLLNDRSKAAGDPDKPEEDLSFVKIDGMRDLPRNRLHFASGWTGGTLEGADLADLPVSDDEVRALLNYGRRLQWLNLTGSEITDDVLSDLAAMRSLANLNLASTAITDERACRSNKLQTSRRTRPEGNAGLGCGHFPPSQNAQAEVSRCPPDRHDTRRAQGTPRSTAIARGPHQPEQTQRPLATKGSLKSSIGTGALSVFIAALYTVCMRS